MATFIGLVEEKPKKKAEVTEEVKEVAEEEKAEPKKPRTKKQ